MFKGVFQKPSESGSEPEPAAGDHPAWNGGIIFLLGMACMAVIQALWPLVHPTPLSARGESAGEAPADTPVAAESSRREPWGEFEYTRLSLEQPHEFVPNTSQPLLLPRWFFANRSRQQVVELFNAATLTERQTTSLLEPRRCQPLSGGYCVSPPAETILNLSRTARERIYSVLSEHPANSAQCHPFRFRPEGFEAWCAETGLGAEQLAILRKLIYAQGGALCFCDGAIVQSLFSPQDFNRFVKELYEERTFLMRLRVTSDTDIDALVGYWGRAGRAQALRPLLESMAQVPGGAAVNISYLLPPFARVRLYTFANPAVDPTANSQNCFWTAMNFFNEKPDNGFFDAAYLRQVLASDYEAVSGPARFGDVIAVEDASGALVHMCVYLADDVVFTKNGHDFVEPWVLMKLPEMLVSYRVHDSARVTLYRLCRL